MAVSRCSSEQPSATTDAFLVRAGQVEVTHYVSSRACLGGLSGWPWRAAGPEVSKGKVTVLASPMSGPLPSPAPAFLPSFQLFMLLSPGFDVSIEMSSLQREDPSSLGQGLCDDPISLPACFHHRTESQAAPVGFSSCLHPLSTPGEQVPAQYCSLAGPGCRSRGHRQEALGSWGCFALRRPIACPGFPESWALLKAPGGFLFPRAPRPALGVGGSHHMKPGGSSLKRGLA